MPAFLCAPAHIAVDGEQGAAKSVSEMSVSKQMRIAFWGNFGALNLGNECTLSVIVAAFRSRLPDADLMAVCRGPDDVATRHQISGVPITSRPAAPQGRRSPKIIRVLRLLRQE